MVNLFQDKTILESQKFGRELIYINRELVEILKKNPPQ